MRFRLTIGVWEYWDNLWTAHNEKFSAWMSWSFSGSHSHQSSGGFLFVITAQDLFIFLSSAFFFWAGQAQNARDNLVNCIWDLEVDAATCNWELGIVLRGVKSLNEGIEAGRNVASVEDVKFCAISDKISHFAGLLMDWLGLWVEQACDLQTWLKWGCCECVPSSLQLGERARAWSVVQYVGCKTAYGLRRLVAFLICPLQLSWWVLSIRCWCTSSLCFELVYCWTVSLFIFISNVCWSCTQLVSTRLPSLRVLSSPTLLIVPFANGIQYLVSRIVVLYSPWRYFRMLLASCFFSPLPYCTIKYCRILSGGSTLSV